jgi:hypothetical protein
LAETIFIIVADRINDEQRAEIHALVKQYSNGWWHHFADAWIVRGRDVAFWRDTVSQPVKGELGSIMVFELANTTASPGWAGFANPKYFEWLHEYFRK